MDFSFALSLIGLFFKSPRFCPFPIHLYFVVAVVVADVVAVVVVVVVFVAMYLVVVSDVVPRFDALAAFPSGQLSALESCGQMERPSQAIAQFLAPFHC